MPAHCISPSTTLCRLYHAALGSCADIHNTQPSYIICIRTTARMLQPTVYCRLDQPIHASSYKAALSSSNIAPANCSGMSSVEARTLAAYDFTTCIDGSLTKHQASYAKLLYLVPKVLPWCQLPCKRPCHAGSTPVISHRSWAGLAACGFAAPQSVASVCSQSWCHGSASHITVS